MKIVIAPQGFKGNLSAQRVAEAIARGIKRVRINAEMDLVPMADGGEGTLESLVHNTRGRIMIAEVTGPFGFGACTDVAKCAANRKQPPKKRSKNKSKIESF